MDYKVNSKLGSLEPYDPVADDCKIHLDANESFLELPQGISQKIYSKIKNIKFNRYPDPLAAGVCEAFAKYAGVGEEYVTAGNGSDELISLIFNDFMVKGGKALILEPDFSMYRIYCFLSECTPVLLKKKDDLKVTPEDIIHAARQNSVDLVIFSNPCNPTGQGLVRGDVLKIVESLGCLVVVDEAYMDFWDESIIGYAPKYENLIVLKTCSKIGFAALRLGFAVAGKYITGYLKAAKSPYNVNSLTQAAGEAVLCEKEYLHNAAAEIRASRDALYKSLKSIESGNFKVYDSRTNFVSVKSAKAGEIHGKLKEAGISVRLLGTDVLRITAGSKEENAELVSALGYILKHIG